MRGLKTTIAGLVLLLLLGGYIYFYEWDTPAGGSETKEKAFAGIQADAIEEVQIKAASGETSRATKSDAGWQIVEPVRTEADPSELSAVTSNIGSLEVQRVVEEKPSDLARYGLNPPRVDVAFRLKGEKNFRHLLLGEKTPTGSDLYAKVPDNTRVFLVSSYLDNTFNRTPFDLRDKSILEFDREKLGSFELSSGGATIQFTKSGNDWRITKPIAARADYGTVESVVTRLSSGQMQRIVEADAADLKKYGLDKPTVTATLNTGSARATLLLGSTEGGSVYAKDSSRPMVFAVEESLATDLKKDVGEFRKKDVFEFRPFTAQRVEISRGASRWVFEKSKDKDGKEIWKNAAGQNTDTTKVEDLLSKLSNLRAESFESTPHASLKSPELTVTATYDGRTETVQIGRAGSDVFAGRADEPGSAKLEATPYEEALKALDAVK